ncbi:MAG: DegT/DnrJ/EryC1/StrS family aminotransferase [Bdellovibrionota bacterium]
MILCAYPKAQYLAHQTEIDAAVRRVFEQGHYVKGEEHQAFEAEFAQYIGARFGVGVANGTDALRIALLSAGIAPGDEVITVAHTAVATVAAVELAGATPVLVDIEPDTYTINPRALEKALTPKTKAVIAVHIYGQAFDLDAVLAFCRKHGLKLIEDCAQSAGARWKGQRLGSFGDLSGFSFYPTKNLGAIGDGGMVLTSDEKLAERARLIREYGWAERYISHISGMNSRLDEVQAAILRVKLRHLDSDNAKRGRIAARYAEGLAGLAFQTPVKRADAEHVFHLYVIRSAHRDAVIQELKAQGVHAGIHYPMPVHLQPAYRGRIRCAGPMAETERAALEILSLPMYPELSTEQVTQVVQALRAGSKQA